MENLGYFLFQNLITQVERLELERFWKYINCTKGPNVRCRQHVPIGFVYQLVMHERVDGIKSGFNFGKKFAFKGFLAFVLLTVKERKIEEGGHRGMKE